MTTVLRALQLAVGLVVAAVLVVGMALVVLARRAFGVGPRRPSRLRGPGYVRMV